MMLLWPQKLRHGHADVRKLPPEINKGQYKLSLTAQRIDFCAWIIKMVGKALRSFCLY